MAAIDVDSSSWDSEILKSSLPVIVDFWAPWCPWCRKLMPDFESLANLYTGKLTFAKINVDKAQEIAAKYGVQGLPTLKMFCSGRPIAEIVGYLPKDSLKTQLDRMLSMHKECLDQSSVLRKRG